MSKSDISEKIATLQFQVKQQQNDLIHSEIFNANGSDKAKERARTARNAAEKLLAEIAELRKRLACDEDPPRRR